MRLLRGLVSGLALVLATGGLSAAQAAASHAPEPGPVVVRRAATPTLTAYGRSGLLLTAVRTDGTLVARVARHAGAGTPTWGPSQRLGRVVRADQPQVALNRRGAGVVAWVTPVRRRTVMARLRDGAGRWSSPYRIPGSSEPAYGAAVNRRGTVAVLASARNAPAVLAVHRRGQRWQVRQLTGWSEGSTSVAVAPDDSVYVAGAIAERGGDGTAMLARLSAGGHWTRSRLPGETHGVESADVFALADGHVDVVVGRASRTWASTRDTEYYWATHYVVRSRAGATGPWSTIWDRDGAADLTAVPSGRDLRLTWTQYADPVPDEDAGLPAPSSLILQTGSTGSEGPVTELARSATTLSTFAGASFTTTSAAGRDCLVVGWRPGTRPYGPLAASVGGASSSWPDAGAIARYDVQAAAACVAGHGYLARTADQVVRRGAAIGGEVRVERLG